MVATFPYCSRCEALTVRGTYFCGAVKVSLVLPKSNLQATHQVFWKQTNKKQLAKQTPEACKTQELQNNSHLLFTNCCFLVLTIVPLKGKYKAPSRWRCTL